LYGWRQAANLSSNEAKGNSKVLEQYAYALDTLDKIRSSKLSIDEESLQKLSILLMIGLIKKKDLANFQQPRKFIW
jgi:hypothetical protein